MKPSDWIELLENTEGIDCPAPYSGRGMIGQPDCGRA